MTSNQQKVYVVDDDEAVRDALSMLLDTVGQPYELYSSGPEFLRSYDESKSGCLVLDIRMPQMSGLKLQAKLNEKNSILPIIFITGHGDIAMAVEAMRQGGLDFIRKPFREQDLLDRINEALDIDAGKRKKGLDRQQLLDRIASLSDREREVFQLVAEGEMNKVVAFKLGISQRTVEAHRTRVMKKLGVRTFAQLIRIKIEAELPIGSDTSF